MTLAAPRSRRGRVTLVLAFVAALAAVGGLVWHSNARAALPTTTLTLSQSPTATSTVNPGATVTYTLTITTTGPNTNGAVVLRIDIDGANLDGVVADVTCPGPGTGGAGITWTAAVDASEDATCTSSAVLAAALTGVTMTYAPKVSGSAATVGGASGSADDAGPEAPIVATNAPSVGPLNVAAVTVTPASATNIIGQPETFTWTLPAGFTCFSDTNADGNVNCAASDVSSSDVPAGATVGGPVVTDADMADTSLVAVTISYPSGSVTDTTTITLNTKFGDNPTTQIDTPDASATKTYLTLTAAGDAHLQHVDIDNATEDVAGDTPIDFDGGQLKCSNTLAGCTEVYPLTIQDDPDDSTGSLHTACLLTTSLGAADDGKIGWIIQTVDGAATVHLENISGRIIMDVDGEGTANDDDEANCIQWRSANPGGQTITAIYIPTGEVIGWDDADADNSGIGDPPLIKQWNTIDFTCIVARDGNVGDRLAGPPPPVGNTGDLAKWGLRDVVGTTVCGANLDGTTVDVGGVLIRGHIGFGRVDAAGRSFIDYTIGQHRHYVGPVDGAEQTYTVSGDCGSVRLEDPVTGGVIILNASTPSATVLSSDKGVAFQVVPNRTGAIVTTPANANCDPSSRTTVTITTKEDVQLRSDLDTAPRETITVHWVVGPPTSKLPQLAWAGMRVALEHDWSAPDGTCPWPEEGRSFFVRYAKLTGKGAIVSDLGNGIAFGPDFVVVRVESDCISRVVYESEDNGEEDIVAHVVEPSESGWSAISEQVAFVLYYMKFEDVTLGLVPGARAGHNSRCGPSTDPCQNFKPKTPPVWDTTNDVDTLSANVSADVLARVRVRGWLERSNCPVRESGVDSNGGFLPANRCIFPDDWEFIAGGVLAEEFRPNYDIMKQPDTTPFLANTTGCQLPPRAAGPFSWLDRALFQLIPTVLPGGSGSLCGDSRAPHVGPLPLRFRETVFPDGDVDEWDAPMPPALVRLLLTGSGFLQGADKGHIYTLNSNPYYVTHIPAERFITPLNEDLTGYQWNTWGVGSKSGLYKFWTSLADHGPEVRSCPGSSPCGAAGVPTGGYKTIKIYTDNHGEAMAFVNGDADLTFKDCDDSGPLPEHNIEIVNGWYCEQGDVVGSSTLNAVADYPDKRKHEPLASNNVEIDWTWGGIKKVFIEPGRTPQFNHVVFQVKDRDGFCQPTPSLHPVFREQVDFLIDSPNGVIISARDFVGDPRDLPAGQGELVRTVTFRRTDADICEARVLVSESLLGPVNVLIRAFDPEGEVIFDVIINEPTPTPSPTPTPEPTPTPPPPPPPDTWGDIDCDGDVDTVDGLGIVRFVAGLPVFQTGPCHALGSSITVDGASERFGDSDCDGDVDLVDGLAILRFVAGMSPLPQSEPCPDIGAGVTIT